MLRVAHSWMNGGAAFFESKPLFVNRNRNLSCRKDPCHRMQWYPLVWEEVYGNYVSTMTFCVCGYFYMHQRATFVII